MNAEQAWRIFEQTGNVQAYLLYTELKTEEGRPPSDGAPRGTNDAEG
mgnify:CR=1 FL=1